MGVPEKRSVSKRQFMWHSILLNYPLKDVE